MSMCRCKTAEARQQAEASVHADTEQQVQSAVDRLQALHEQEQSQAASWSAGSGRLQAALARCDRTEASLIAQQGRTQQVMDQYN